MKMTVFLIFLLFAVLLWGATVVSSCSTCQTNETIYFTASGLNPKRSAAWKVDAPFYTFYCCQRSVNPDGTATFSYTTPVPGRYTVGVYEIYGGRGNNKQTEILGSVTVDVISE